MISGYLGFNRECLSFGQNGFVSNPIWSLVGVRLVNYNKEIMLIIIYSDIKMAYVYMSFLSLRV